MITATQREVPEGYRLEWHTEGHNWKLADLDRVCRKKGCQNPAVAALRRGFRRPSWGHYCADHLYGRKIEDGVVKVERLVEITERAELSEKGKPQL